MVRLGDVCTFYSGTGFPNIYQGKADGKYPFYKVGDISRNVLSGNRELKICENYIDDDTVTKIKGTLLPPQTVVFAKIGEALRLNRRAITSRDCLVDNNAMGIKSDDSIIDSLYFYYFMCNVDLQNYCESTTVPSVRKTRIAEIEIPLPPLDEQRRIAAVLDKVSDLIAKRREQLDKLDELVKARFVEMFGDPVLNPMDWPTYQLADMADIVSGITKGRKTKEQDLIEVPYMAVSNVKDGYIDWTTIKTIGATQSEIDQYRLLPDDVLMTEGGDPDKLGRGAIIQNPLENCIHQNHIFRVRLNENIILPVYFAEFLQHQKAKQYFLRCAKQTTGIASINMTQLKELPTLVPPRALQKDFTNTVEQINKSKLTIQQSLDKLEVLKKALMQQYFG